VKPPTDWGSKIIVLVTVLIVVGYLVSRGFQNESTTAVTSVPVKETKPQRRSLDPGQAEMVDLNAASVSEITALGLQKSQAEALIKKRPLASIEQAVELLGLKPDEAKRLSLRAYVPKPGEKAPIMEEE
jgi:hypothetical protein